VTTLRPSIVSISFARVARRAAPPPLRSESGDRQAPRKGPAFRRRLVMARASPRLASRRLADLPRPCGRRRRRWRGTCRRRRRGTPQGVVVEGRAELRDPRVHRASREAAHRHPHGPPESLDVVLGRRVPQGLPLAPQTLGCARTCLGIRGHPTQRRRQLSQATEQSGSLGWRRRRRRIAAARTAAPAPSHRTPLHPPAMTI